MGEGKGREFLSFGYGIQNHQKKRRERNVESLELVGGITLELHKLIQVVSYPSKFNSQTEPKEDFKDVPAIQRSI